MLFSQSSDLLLGICPTPQFIQEFPVGQSGDPMDCSQPWLKTDAQITLKLFLLCQGPQRFQVLSGHMGFRFDVVKGDNRTFSVQAQGGWGGAE